jgi:hypothetical protein
MRLSGRKITHDSFQECTDKGAYNITCLKKSQAISSAMKNTSYILLLEGYLQQRNLTFQTNFYTVDKFLLLIDTFNHIGSCLKAILEKVSYLTNDFLLELQSLGRWIAPYLKTFKSSLIQRSYKDTSSKRNSNRRKWKNRKKRKH